MHQLFKGKRPAFSHVFETQSLGPGVLSVEHKPLQIASLALRKGRAAELEARIRGDFAVTPPHKPQRIEAGPHSIVGTGPGRWLILFEDGSYDLGRLAQLMNGCASVVDVTDAFSVLRLSGPALRQTLEKLIPVDLHPKAFAVGDAASTLAGNITVTIWRLADPKAGQSAFDLVVPRSFTGSIWHELWILTGMNASSSPTAQAGSLSA